ncbi:hypothetical protein IJ818_06350 [bacterium]|nr:hypothetical protein [bacterium]
MIKAKYGDLIFTIEDDKTVTSSEKSKLTILENILDEIILDYDKPTNKIPAEFLADKLENMGFEILNVVDYGMENVPKSRIY